MKATTLISALAFVTAAFAQASQPTSTSASASSVSAPNAKSSTASTATSSKPTPTDSYADISKSVQLSSLIPSTISANCSTFLTSLNTDKDLGTELNKLTSAVSAFSGNGGSYGELASTLSTLCAIDSWSASIGSKLTEFKDKCSDELISRDSTVLAEYDTLYALGPFKDAICAKPAGSEEYCLINKAASSTTPANNAATTSTANNATPTTRRKRAQTVLIPNPEVYASDNLPFLHTSPDMDAGDLCTSCTQQILAKYAKFQSATQHALGAAKSPLLGGQTALRDSITEKCGKPFAAEISKLAGVKTAEELGNGASPAFVGSIFTAVAGALATVMALI